MGSPRISVIMPIFKEEGLLKDSIESVLSQTFSDVETILIDNNASPETHRIAQEYADRYPKSIRLVHEPKQGSPNARNTGIRECRGEYIALLDADDLMYPERLKLQYEFMHGRKDISLVTSKFNFIDRLTGNVLEKDLTQKFWDEIETEVGKLFPDRKDSQGRSTFYLPLTPTVFLRKETALKVGLFDVRFCPRDFDDVEFFVRVFEEGDFHHIPQVLASYRISSKTSKKNKGILNFYRHAEAFLSVLWERYSAQADDRNKTFRNLQSIILRRAGLQFLEIPQAANIGRHLIRRSVYAKPWNLDAWKLWTKTFLPKNLHPQLFWFGEHDSDSLPPGIDTKFAQDFLQWPISPLSIPIQKSSLRTQEGR